MRGKQGDSKRESEERKRERGSVKEKGPESERERE